MSFQYIMALSFTWILSLILTKARAFESPKDFSARTDVHEELLSEAPWFRWPYPCKFRLKSI